MVEKDFAEVLLHREHADGADAHPGRIERHQEVADAILRLRGLLVGARQHVAPLRLVGARGPGFLAGDGPAVAVPDRLGAQAREIGARVGFAVALAPDLLARQDLRQEILALRRCSELDEHRPRHHHAVVRIARAAVGVEHLGHDDALGGVQAHAAVFTRPGRCCPATAGQFRVPAARHRMGQLANLETQFGRVVGFDELADHGAESVVAHRVVVGAGFNHGGRARWR